MIDKWVIWGCRDQKPIMRFWQKTVMWRTHTVIFRPMVIRDHVILLTINGNRTRDWFVAPCRRPRHAPFSRGCSTGKQREKKLRVFLRLFVCEHQAAQLRLEWRKNGMRYFLLWVEKNNSYNLKWSTLLKIFFFLYQRAGCVKVGLEIGPAESKISFSISIFRFIITSPDRLTRGGTWTNDWSAQQLHLIQK